MRWLEDLAKDVRLAGRSLARQPGFTLVCLLTLTLGIGATTVVFGVVNAALLRPLPYPDADRLVQVQEENQMNRGREMPAFMTSPTLEAWSEDPQTIEAIAGYSARTFTYWTDDGPVRLRGAEVTSELFGLLRATPLFGRGFTEMDSRPKTSKTMPVAVLSYRAWQTWFDGDLDMLGQLIKLDGGAYSVVGVMPEGFTFPEDETEIWVPLSPYSMSSDQPQLVGERFVQAFSGIARLRDGVSLAQAQAEAQTVMGRLASPMTQGATLRLVSFQDEMVGEARPALLALMAAVGLVLLIVTANLANLLLARGAARQRELAVRAAIGAGRARLIRQLVTESVALGLLGGALGLAASYWVLGALPSLAPTGIPGLNEAGVDTTVLGFAVAVSLGAGLLFGLMPAVNASRFNLVGALNEGTPAMGSGFRFRPGNRTRSVLVVGEVALALMLLVGAGLLVRSFLGLMRVDPGFNPEGLLTAELNLLPMKPGQVFDEGGFFDQLSERLGGHPGVEAAGFVSSLPLTPGESLAAFRFEGQPPATRLDEVTAARPQLVSPGYFRAMGLRLVDGRFLTSEDLGNALSTVVNEAFARAYLPDRTVVGQRLYLVDDRPIEIVGVVGDVLHRGLDSRPEPELYIAYAQWPFDARLASVDVAVRTGGDPLAFVPFLRQDVAAVQQFAVVDDVMTMEARLAASVAQPRFFAIVLGAFAVAALVLAMVGIYGVLAYSVSRRRREIGLRMALGADAGGIRNMVVQQGAILVGVGVVLGLAGAVATTRVLESMLFGVTTLDLPTLVAVPALLVLASLVACYLPARRATRVDPMDALRGT